MEQAAYHARDRAVAAVTEHCLAAVEMVVEDGAECICLVALQGEIRLQGWIGRMLQPFVRI